MTAPCTTLAGMQLLLYSKLSAEQSGNAWSRTGHTISYHKTNIKHIPPEMLGKSLYTLSWTMVWILKVSIIADIFHHSIFYAGISLF